MGRGSNSRHCLPAALSGLRQSQTICVRSTCCRSSRASSSLNTGTLLLLPYSFAVLVVVVAVVVAGAVLVVYTAAVAFGCRSSNSSSSFCLLRRLLPRLARHHRHYNEKIVSIMFVFSCFNLLSNIIKCRNLILPAPSMLIKIEFELQLSNNP